MRCVILSPIVSEKSNLLIDQGKFSFFVHPSATKVEVSRFVESFFSVRVGSVNVMNLKGKAVRRRGRLGRKKLRRKAIVTVLSGDFDGLRKVFV